MLEALYGADVTNELRKLIPKGSFASYLISGIGRTLQDTVESIDQDDKDGFWGAYPVQELYELLASGWCLDHEWFMYTDGVYRDDNENEIPLSIPRTYSAVEQIAAYGLYWLSSSEINCMGQLPDVSGVRFSGRASHLNYAADCCLLA